MRNHFVLLAVVAFASVPIMQALSMPAAASAEETCSQDIEFECTHYHGGVPHECAVFKHGGNIHLNDLNKCIHVTA